MASFAIIYQLTNTKNETIVCPNCNGTGIVERSMWPNTNNTKHEVCPLCKGKRVVIKEVTTSYRELK